MDTFKIAGVSTHKGIVRLRLTNDLESRMKVLTKEANTDINLITLPSAMSKVDAVKYLLTQPAFTDNALTKACLEKVAGKKPLNVANMGVKIPSKPEPVAVDADIEKLADETLVA